MGVVSRTGTDRDSRETRQTWTEYLGRTHTETQTVGHRDSETC